MNSSSPHDLPSLPDVSALLQIGWREWIALPDLGIPRIKAKVDTGARSSTLHAFDIEPFERDSQDWVRFSVQPFQRDTQTVLNTEAPLVDRRRVRSSSGHEELRYVVATRVLWRGMFWAIELTLTDRDRMGFRMLLGRQAIRGRYVVNPGRSYLGGTIREQQAAE